MRGGNPLIQFSQQLVSGFSTPENVAAAQILMVGWVNDMFAGNQDEGIYLDPGEEFAFDTPAGEATAMVASELADQAVPVEPVASVGAAGERFLHVRADVRRGVDGHRRMYGFDGRLIR